MASISIPGMGRLAIIRDAVANILFQQNNELAYVVESKDWIIKRIGQYVTDQLNKNKLVKARIVTTAYGLKNQIVHYGSINAFLNGYNMRKPDLANKTVITWFHIREGDEPHIQQLVAIQEKIHFVHTAASKTKEELVNAGFPEEKIIVIPLGIDESIFMPVDDENKLRLHAEMGIPENKVIIGSFQKDGNGWGAGIEPKLIKGPDVFIETVKKINAVHPAFVLLVGPARGYVENGLKQSGIPYKSIGYLDDFDDIVPYYNVLDLYIIASRLEGGPQQILEAWASGIPVVSTKVGMIIDIARHEYNALLTEIEDVDMLFKQACRVINDSKLRSTIVDNALREIDNFSWKCLSRRYFDEIYSKL